MADKIKAHVAKGHNINNQSFVITGGRPLKQLADRLPKEVFAFLKEGMKENGIEGTLATWWPFRVGRRPLNSCVSATASDANNDLVMTNVVEKK